MKGKHSGLQTHRDYPQGSYVCVTQIHTNHCDLSGTNWKTCTYIHGKEQRCWNEERDSNPDTNRALVTTHSQGVGLWDIPQLYWGADRNRNTPLPTLPAKSHFADRLSAPHILIHTWWMIAFITWNSHSIPLLDGLFTSNTCRFEFSMFGVFAGIEPTTLGLTVKRSDQLS